MGLSMDDASLACARFRALLDAVDAERSRVASHLHDGVMQNLAVVSMRLAMIDAAVHDEKTAKAILECGSLIQESIREIRLTSYFLQPPLVVELGLTDSLRMFADTFTAANGVGLQLDLDPAGVHGLSPEVQLALFRIVMDSARGLASSGITNLHAGVFSTGDSVAITLSGSCGPTRVDPEKSLFWWIVEERAVRHGGQARLSARESTIEIQVLMPIEREKNGLSNTDCRRSRDRAAGPPRPAFRRWH